MSPEQESKPTPPPSQAADPEAAEFWEAAAEGRLVYSACSTCGAAWFPLRAICAGCSGECATRVSAGAGEVVSWSRVHRSSDTGFRDILPYVVAIVALDEGYRMVANVEPVEDVRIGDRCVVSFRPSPATGRPAPLFMVQRG